nr:glycosyltransferase [uncultured Cellulosilyticum sp.]
MKFSIIVPIYNVEKYLPTCIESVLTQTYTEFELILVDDGSPDKCNEICDKYAIKDSRIKVIHKINRGLPAARNSGLYIATGDYVMHLDGDDFWDKYYLENAYEILKPQNVDICFGDRGTDYYDDGRTKEFILYDINLLNNKHDIMTYFLDYQHKAPHAVFHNIYNLKFIKEHSLYFTETLTWSEDEDYFYTLLQKINTFTFCNYNFYFYRKSNLNAMTKNITAKNILSKMYVQKKWFDYYKQLSINPAIRRLALERFANRYMELIRFINKLPTEECRPVIDYIKENNYILEYVTGYKKQFIKLIYDLAGYRTGNKLLNAIKPC